MSVKQIVVNYVNVKGNGDVLASITVDGEKIDYVKVKRVFFNDFCIENEYEVRDY